MRKEQDLENERNIRAISGFGDKRDLSPEEKALKGAFSTGVFLRYKGVYCEVCKNVVNEEKPLKKFKGWMCSECKKQATK